MIRTLVKCSKLKPSPYMSNPLIHPESPAPKYIHYPMGNSRIRAPHICIRNNSLPRLRSCICSTRGYLRCVVLLSDFGCVFLARQGGVVLRVEVLDSLLGFIGAILFILTWLFGIGELVVQCSRW
jgi:hypothetical protein